MTEYATIILLSLVSKNVLIVQIKIKIFLSVSEHRVPRGLRAVEDPRHRFLRPRHVGPAQRKEAILRNENPRQTKSKLSPSF